MSIQQSVLRAALRICRERDSWTFGPREVVAALPELNPGSVRTHVMSRCCVNAPAHHAHRWPYFRRVRRGVYEIVPAWRRKESTAAETAGGRSRIPRADLMIDVRESGAGYVAQIRGKPGKLHDRSLDALAALVRRAGRNAGQATMRVDLEVEPSDPVIDAYKKDIDRTLIRQSLCMGFEDRLRALQSWANGIETLRKAARRSKGRTVR